MSGHVDVSEELPDAVPGSVQIEHQVQQRRKRVIDEHLTSQVKDSSKKQVRKQVERQKIKSAYKVLLPKWRQEQKELRLSRKQLLSLLIPSAGETHKKQKVIEESKKVV